MVNELPLPMFWNRLKASLEMIKFEHSVFALPFALTAALLAFREKPTDGGAALAKVFWIVVAMVGTRSAAMAFNRVLDAEIDGRNPRTRMRHIPAAMLSARFAWTLVAAAALVFLTASWMLNPVCLMLAPLALGVVFFYSYTKRFTSLSHVVLGLSLGIAPAAAWIAVTGSLDARILWLTAAVTFWTAGFDVIYSCQDFEFDRAQGLFSIPGRFGIAAALRIARVFHGLMAACLLALVRTFHLGWLSLAGVAAVGGLLVYEHSLVKPSDLSRINAAFFTVNGWVGMVFLLFWAADIYLPRVGTWGL